MLEQELQKLGLSDKEARVYISSLQLGKSVVQEIAEQSKVNRGTAYNIIESLMKKGLMSSFEQGKKTYFTAESPDRLSSLIKIQEEELKLKEREFSKFLPELRSMYGSADNKPKVKYYEGIKGLDAIKEEYLKSKSKSILSFSKLDSVLKVFPRHLDNYTPKRIKAKIKARMIYTSDDNNFRLKSDKNLLRETQFIPIDMFPFKSDISVFDNKISFLSMEGKEGGILIEDKMIADSMAAIFEYMWKKK